MMDIISDSEQQITDIRIFRSNKRRKTASAKLNKNVLCVYVPSRISESELERAVSFFKKRFTRSLLKKKLNKARPLSVIAERINREYFSGKLNIASIEYVTDQVAKFGCCNYLKRTIRISHRIYEMPDWVRDYVVLHEMAHLLEPNHSRSFWEIVSRYKLSERAKGYLLAKGIDEEDILNEVTNEET